MLTGSINLWGKNFLADLSKIRVGTAGHLCMTDSNRTNVLYDSAVNGLEASGEMVNPKGIRMIACYKRLRIAPWILGGYYPTSEAYAGSPTQHEYPRATADS